MCVQEEKEKPTVRHIIGKRKTIKVRENSKASSQKEQITYEGVRTIRFSHSNSKCKKIAKFLNELRIQNFTWSQTFNQI